MTQRLTDEQIEQLKSILLSEREQLSEVADVDLGRLRKQPFRKLAGEVHDQGDESIADQVAGLNAELADRRALEIHAIDEALRRIDQGTYGICVDCGTDIAFERLKAFPMAKRCIDCKAKYESQHPSPGTPTL